MGRIEVPEDFMSILDKLNSRVDVLEKSPRLISGVLSRVAYCDTTQNQNYVETTGVNQDMTMDTLQTWQVNRHEAFLILVYAYGKTSGGSGNFSYIKWSVRNGAAPGNEIDSFGNALWDKGITGYTGAYLHKFLDVITYPVTLQIRPVTFGDTGQTLAHYYCHVDVFALGA